MMNKKNAIMPVISLGSNIIRSNFKRLNAPYKVNFVVTYRCNLKCKVCSIWKKKPVNELTLKEIKEFFKKNNQFVWVDLMGGETTLRPDIVAIAREIKKYCRNIFQLHFATNGRMPKHIAAVVREMSILGIPKIIITVSLDGPEDMHDYLRGVKGAFGSAIETFKELRKIKGVETYFGMTLSQHNINLVDSTYAELKKRIPNMTIKDMHINIAQTSAHYYDNVSPDNELNRLNPKDIKKVKELNNKLIKRIDDFQRRRGLPLNPIAYLERRYLSLAKKYLKTARSPMPCAALSASCFIDPTGVVYPCISYSKQLGNIRKVNYDLKKIWDKKEVVQLQKEIRRLKCPQCWTPCEAYQSIFSNLLR